MLRPMLLAIIFCGLVAGAPAQAEDQQAASTPAGPRNLGNLLCLGDSITVCLGESGTWRYGLWKHLLERGYTFDYIGTQGREDCPRAATPDYEGRDFDHDNEGHGGWTTGDLLHGRGEDASENLAKWLVGYTPETVLLHIGGNDLQEARDKPWGILGIVEKAQENLRKIIRLLQADNPNVTIYLALHIKVNGDKILFANGGIALYNAGLPAIARDLSTPESRIILVDHNTGWSNDLLGEDGIHPNAAGNERMANVWFESIDLGPRSITLQPPIVSCVPQCDGKSVGPAGWGDLLLFGASLAVLKFGAVRGI